MKTKLIQVLLLSAVLGMEQSAVHAACAEGMPPPEVITGTLDYSVDEEGYMGTDYALIDMQERLWALYVESPFNDNPNAPMGYTQGAAIDAMMDPFMNSVVEVTGCTSDGPAGLIIDHVSRIEIADHPFNKQ